MQSGATGPKTRKKRISVTSFYASFHKSENEYSIYADFLVEDDVSQ
jgi:hypothetical protein